MGIFQSDMAIKTAIELSMEDMRKNPWLLDDVLSDCVTNPYLKLKYGQKQIDSFKEWFANNKINVVMAARTDKDEFPLVTITLGTNSEKDDHKTMGDSSTETVMLYPKEINKSIAYIVKPFPFTGSDYDDVTGLLTVDADLKGMDTVVATMLVVDPDTGKAYIIQDVTNEGLVLEPDLDITATRLAVVPKFQYYVARREHAFFQETYSIKCHAHGDPQTLLWLWSIVLYSILRYRESMLESQGFTESSVSSGEMVADPFYSQEGGDIVWMRPITLTGMTENSWIKSPQRIIESVAPRDKVADKGYRGGIQILSNNKPDSVEQEMQQLWFPVDESDTDNEE